MRLFGIEDSVVHLEEHFLIWKSKRVASALFELSKEFILLPRHTFRLPILEDGIELLLSLLASAIDARCSNEPINSGFNSRGGRYLLDSISEAFTPLWLPSRLCNLLHSLFGFFPFHSSKY